MSAIPSFTSPHRRRILQTAGLALSVPAWSFALSESPDHASSLRNQAVASPTFPPGFPTQPPELVHEMVMVSHFDLKRVQQLVEAKPSLARAAWDWGFGDWESALGAASHMGNRPIAEYLLSKGARPSLFSAAMFGHLDVVNAFINAHPGLQRTRGPHSISLLAHAKAGGPSASAVYDYLAFLGDAGSDTRHRSRKPTSTQSSASTHSARLRTIASTSPPRKVPSPGPANAAWDGHSSITATAYSTPLALRQCASHSRLNLPAPHGDPRPRRRPHA